MPVHRNVLQNAPRIGGGGQPHTDPRCSESDLSSRSRVARFFAAAAGGESRGQSGNDWRPVSAPDAPLPLLNGNFVLDNIRKSYVTSAGHVSHYIMFCRVDSNRLDGPPDLLMFEADKVHWETLGEWDGLGMRGNCSAPMLFNGEVPYENLLGIELEGEKEPVMQKYMMPVLILTYGAAYLGIASGAFELACIEGDRRYASGGRRLDNPINQRRIAEMSARLESARSFLHVGRFDDGRRQGRLVAAVHSGEGCVFRTRRASYARFDDDVRRHSIRAATAL